MTPRERGAFIDHLIFVRSHVDAILKRRSALIGASISYSHSLRSCIFFFFLALSSRVCTTHAASSLTMFPCLFLVLALGWDCRARQPSPMLRVNSEEIIELTPPLTIPTVDPPVCCQNSSMPARADDSATYVTATFGIDDISKL